MRREHDTAKPLLAYRSTRSVIAVIKHTSSGRDERIARCSSGRDISRCFYTGSLILDPRGPVVRRKSTIRRWVERKSHTAYNATHNANMNRQRTCLYDQIDLSRQERGAQGQGRRKDPDLRRLYISRRIFCIAPHFLLRRACLPAFRLPPSFRCAAISRYGDMAHLLHVGVRSEDNGPGEGSNPFHRSFEMDCCHRCLTAQSTTPSSELTYNTRGWYVSHVYGPLLLIATPCIAV